MKKVVWSETVVRGGAPVEQQLEALPDVAGPYQDCPRWGADPTAHRFAQDWVAVAVPAAQVPSRLVPTAVAASAPIGDWAALVDGRFGDAVSLPRDPDGPSTAWIEQIFDEPVTVGSRHRGAARPTRLRRRAAAGRRPRGRRRRRGLPRVAEIAEVVVPAAKAVPVRTVAFPPVTARRFRLVLTGHQRRRRPAPAGAGRAAAAGAAARVPSSSSPSSRSRSGGRVHQAEVKAGFAAAPDYDAIGTDRAAATRGDRPRSRCST